MGGFVVLEARSAVAPTLGIRSSHCRAIARVLSHEYVNIRIGSLELYVKDAGGRRVK
jgi:hypothetical protein